MSAELAGMLFGLVIFVVFLLLRLVWPEGVWPRVDGARPDHPLMTTHRIVMRTVIEAQLLALGVPPERSVDEARLILERHLDTPMTEAGIAEMHDDIVSTALAWA